MSFGGFNNNVVRLHCGHAGDENSAMSRRAAADNSLMIGARCEERPTTAGIDLFQLEFSFAGEVNRTSGPGCVDRFAIGRRCKRYILCVLIAAFDLESGYPRGDNLWHLLECVEIAR